MWFFSQILIYLLLIVSCTLTDCLAITQYHFVVKEASYTRLCRSKKILTVNGEFPGPTLRVRKGETIFVNVYNKGRENITIHWHGVKQPRNPWSDGPEYITQCPIKPGGKFKQKVIFSTEEGTLWWHAHSDWARATVHGAIIVYPTLGTNYPFLNPHDVEEVPIILGEWWKSDVMEVMEEFLRTGGAPNVSDAFTINGQPGDLYPCSNLDTFKLKVNQNKTYLLRLVNAALNTNLFFSVARHPLTVIGSDASYTKPLTADYITIPPGQTMDVLLTANQCPGQYYMAARAYSTGNIDFDNTTTTALLAYNEATKHTKPRFPSLPFYNDTESAFDFITKLRSLADQEHPINVPLDVMTRLMTTISINTLPCPENRRCEGPNGTRLAASMNNITFVRPMAVDILEAYYYHTNSMNRAFKLGFPKLPPLFFDFTAEYLPLELQLPNRETKVIVMRHGSLVEIVFQGTNLVAGLDHPMHLHGYSFFVVGLGFGNFDKEKDELRYNLIDPPMLNTMLVPRNGWVAIRFAANNPGVWFMHCHLERHLSWGMETVFIVENGKGRDATLLPPPRDMPPC